MKYIIRIVWFIVSMMFYSPAMKGLNAVNANFFVKSIVAISIFLLTFYIPSNACIAMFNKSPKQRAKKLCRCIWNEVNVFFTSTGRPWACRDWDYFTATYVWSAFYYSILYNIEYYQLEGEMRSQLLSSGVSMVSPTTSTHPRIIRDCIGSTFESAIREFTTKAINPCVGTGTVELYNSMIHLCDPQASVNPKEYVAFSASLSRISEYAEKLFGQK